MKIDKDGIKIDSFQEILTELIDGYRAIYGDDIDLMQNTPDGQRVGLEARMHTDLQQLAVYIYNEMDPDLASMNGLRILGKLNGVQVELETHSSWDIEIVTDRKISIRDGFAIRDNLDQKWTAQAQELQQGDNTVTFKAVSGGAVSGGSSVRFDTNVIGLISATPVGNVRVGREGETEEEFKARRAETIAISAQSIIGGLISGLYAVPDVTDVAVYENYEKTKDPTTQLAGNSLYCVVENGDVSRIAEAIAKHKTIGVKTLGETVGTWLEKVQTTVGVYEHEHVMSFDRPTYVDVHVKLKATRQLADEPIDVEQIQNQVGSVKKRIGEDLQAGELYKHAYTSVSRYIVTDMEISRSASTGFVKSFLQPAMNERFILKPENVKVTVV